MVRTLGKEKRSLIPSPVIHLQISDPDSGTDITEHLLCTFFARACLLDGDPDLLIGTTVVSGDFVRANGQRFLLFNFNNLGLTQKGEFRLRFEIYVVNGFVHPSLVYGLGNLISTPFTCYSLRMFYSKEITQKRDAILAGVTEINNNLLTLPDAYLPKLQNVVLRRQRRVSDAGDKRPKLGGHSRKRVSISLNDDETDLLSDANFDTAYFGGSTYPSSPKRQRSPLVLLCQNIPTGLFDDFFTQDSKDAIFERSNSSPLPDIVTSLADTGFLEPRNDSRPGSSEDSFYSALEPVFPDNPLNTYDPLQRVPSESSLNELERVLSNHSDQLAPLEKVPSLNSYIDDDLRRSLAEIEPTLSNKDPTSLEPMSFLDLAPEMNFAEFIMSEGQRDEPVDPTYLSPDMSPPLNLDNFHWRDEV